MEKQLFEKLEKLYWERCIDIIANTKKTKVEDIMEICQTYLTDFLKNLEIYIDTHWELADMSKQQSKRLYQILIELRDSPNLNKDEEWAYTQMINLLKEMPSYNYKLYLMSNFAKRFNYALYMEGKVDNYDLYSYHYDESQLDYYNMWLNKTKIIELSLLSKFLYESDEDYYINYIQSLTTKEHSVPAICGLCYQAPEMLKDLKIYLKCFDVIYLKYQVYKQNRVLTHNTTISLPFADVDDQKYKINYVYSKDTIKHMKSFKEQNKIYKIYKMFK